MASSGRGTRLEGRRFVNFAGCRRPWAQIDVSVISCLTLTRPPYARTVSNIVSARNESSFARSRNSATSGYCLRRPPIVKLRQEHRGSGRNDHWQQRCCTVGPSRNPSGRIVQQRNVAIDDRTAFCSVTRTDRDVGAPISGRSSADNPGFAVALSELTSARVAQSFLFGDGYDITTPRSRRT